MGQHGLRPHVRRHRWRAPHRRPLRGFPRNAITATLTADAASADNRQVQGVPRQGAERPPAREAGARQPFEPDPGRAGVGTGTPRQKPPSSSQMLPGSSFNWRNGDPRCPIPLHSHPRSSCRRSRSFGSPPGRSRPRAKSMWRAGGIPRSRSRCARSSSTLRPASRRCASTTPPAPIPTRHRDRHQPGPARIAQAVDPGARRCRVLRGPRGQARGQWPAPRRGERGVVVRPRPPPGIARQARRGGHPAGLCAARHHHPRDGICRDPREPRPREIAARGRR